MSETSVTADIAARLAALRQARREHAQLRCQQLAGRIASGDDLDDHELETTQALLHEAAWDDGRFEAAVRMLRRVPTWRTTAAGDLDGLAAAVRSAEAELVRVRAEYAAVEQEIGERLNRLRSEARQVEAARQNLRHVEAVYPHAFSE